MMHGVFVATTTPFREDGSLDVERYRNQLVRLFDSGVDGVVPAGTTGEGPTLEDEERRELYRLAVTVAKDRGGKVIAGAGSNSTRETIARVREAAEAGADAALVVTPYYNKPTQSGLIAHYRAVADEGGLPVVLYHVPGRTGVGFQPETLEQLLEHRNIVGLKEAGGNHGFWTRLAEMFPKEGKTLYAGDDDAFAVLGAYGAQGIISATANVAPRHFVALWRAIRERKWDEAFRIQKKLFPLVAAMFAETNPAPAKAALARLGLDTGRVRLPLVGIRPETSARISAAFYALGDDEFEELRL
jgi:4-hydroxy-tetrahydrodipicolinate synthase